MTTPPTPPTTAAPKTPPTPDDYRIDLAVTEKQCFGTAGCSVTVRPELAVAGIDASVWDEDVSVTFEVSGDESGPVVQTYNVDPDGKYYPDDVHLSTANTAVVSTAKVTAVG